MATQKTNVSAWLSEFFTRFKLQSPRFFQIWQIIGMALLIITGIPELLKQMYEQTGIDLWTMLPAAVQVLASQTIAVAGFVIKFMAKLPVNNVNAVIGNSEKLPFTEKKKTEGIDVSAQATIKQVTNGSK